MYLNSQAMGAVLFLIFSLYSTNIFKVASAFEQAQLDAATEALESFKTAVAEAEGNGLDEGCLADAKSAATNMESTLEACKQAGDDHLPCVTRVEAMPDLVQNLKGAFIDGCGQPQT